MHSTIRPALAVACVSFAALLSSQSTPREQVGPLPTGGFLLNSGWRVDAVGKQVELSTFPMASALTPDGKHLLILNGGYRSNVIPSEAKATLDVRMVPEEDPAAFLEAVKRVINNPAVTARYTSNTSRPIPPPAKLDSEAYKVVQSAVARNYDTIAIPMMGTGATDMAQVRNKGQQCFGIGPASDLEDGPKGFGAHSDQERILEAEIYRFVRFSYEIVYDLARRN